jgi:hypothetical protein
MQLQYLARPLDRRAQASDRFTTDQLDASAGTIDVSSSCRRRTDVVAAMCLAGLATSCGAGGKSSFDGGTTTALVAPMSSGFNGFGDSGLVVADSSAVSSGSSGPDTKVLGMMYSDFPAGAVIDSAGVDAGTAAPSNAAALFGQSPQALPTGGPCLVEPEINAIYPDNWLRPRFRWVAASGENLFELRVHVSNQQNDLVVYTGSNGWTMPQALWDALRGHSYDEAITLTIRGGTVSGNALLGEAVGSSGAIGIAPVDAPGSIVYWTTSKGTALEGFSVGDETVAPVLVPGQVQEFSTQCIGCHNSTPDGDYASFSSAWSWDNGFASVTPPNTGVVPSWLGAAAQTTLQTGVLGIHTFSAAHWSPGDRIEVSGFDPQDDMDSELIWIDLEAASTPASGILQRTGDTRHAGAPSWSHDGTRIAYVSTDANVDGRLDDGPADIYVVPYNNRAGGQATALQGADDATARDYYPAWSSDDRLIVFDKTASGSMYSSPGAEVYVVSSQGGTATRLAANDPPACTGQASPGVTNSWPKWAPAVASTSDGRTFYWVVFSSVRDPYTTDGSGNPQPFQVPQLYLSAVVVDSAGNLATYGALYFWNQPESEENHTPAWDYFTIPSSTTTLAPK